jgi:hypothetical protein
MPGVTRRKFLATTLLAAAMPARGAARAETGSIEADVQGCFLRGQSDARVVDRFRLFTSSDDKEADQVCRTAETDLRRLFRVSPELWFFDDGSTPNAYATPFLRRGSLSADGTVLIGRALVARVSRRNELNRRWQHRLTGFVAHEWAHIVQFARNHHAAGKAAELHADFLAGWFLGRTAGSSGVRDEAMYRFYFLGDHAVNHPDHHGTPMERASAATAGFDLAAKVDDIDAAFGARRF